MMRNPLNKRFKREIKNGFGRYLVIFLLLFLSIGEVSGFLVVDHSLITAYENSFEKYNVEDGNFTSAAELSDEQRKETENEGVVLFENFYSDKEMDNDTTLRIFKNREDINLASIHEGTLPDAAGEIALDRLYAKNNEIEIGEEISHGSDKWKITGLVALSDYSALFKNNTDMMFDTTGFGVSVVSEEGWEKIDKNSINYRYSWKYNISPSDEKEEKELSDKLLENVSTKVMLTDYTPRYLNQSIMFTGEDFGQDRAMIQLLLYIIIVIIAFIFAVTVKNMINKESAVIGTLLSSGFKKGELLRHYAALPILITIAGAIAGNILGYTVMKDINAAAYYGSYSLPTYETLWNPGAFIQTTVIPVAIVMAINFIIIRYSLSYPPLNFLRGELSRSSGKKVRKLSYGSSISSRFRKRIFASNIGSYAVIIIGIFFSNILLMFGFMLPSTLDSHKSMMHENMICENTYILKAPAETVTEGAEKFAAHTLGTKGENGYKPEDITVYGVEADSRYVHVDDADKIYISKAYADKYNLEPGDVLELSEKYENKEYEFKVEGIYDYEGEIALFTGLDNLNDIFGEEAGSFSGYYSDNKIEDIDEALIASVIDEDEMTKAARQLELSMGSIMGVIRVFSVVMFVIIIYILSRLIIEKSSKSISLTKILGYKNKEIGGLYLATTSLVVIAGILGTIVLSRFVVDFLYTEMMIKSMSGWMPLVVDASVYIKMAAIGICSYAAVALLELIKIKKVPMGMALKEAAI